MSRSYRPWILAAIAVVIAAGAFLPIFSTTCARGTQTKNLSNAKQLATGCQLYAADHQGGFPVHLNELEPDYLPAGSLQQLRCTILEHDKRTEHLVDWLYFGSGFNEAHPPAILIVSPETQIARPSGQELRIYVQGDLTAKVGQEADYRKLLAATVAQMREKDRVSPPPPATPTPPVPAPNP